MKLKPKGRKIYRQKSKFDRVQDFKSNTAAIVGTVLAAGVFVFVGYSVGGPVIRFLQDSHILAVPSEVEETVPPTEETAPPTERPDSATEEVTEPAPPEAPRIRGYQLGTDALVTQTALEGAIAQIPEDTTHVFVPLKTQGGELYYATSLSDAARCGAVRAAVPLPSIYETVEAAGFEPVAVINTLEDTIYPQTYMESAYRYEGGEIWLDAPPEKDGKPHLSPFSSMTQDYLGRLAEEVAAAGFGAIVCDGLTFPEFSEEDLTHIESRAAQEGRYTALTGIIEVMQEKAPHTAFYAYLNASGILMNETEGLAAADSVELTAIILRLDALSADNTDLLDGLTQRNPCIFAWDGVPVPDGEISYISISNASVSDDSDETEAEDQQE